MGIKRFWSPKIKGKPSKMSYYVRFLLDWEDKSLREFYKDYGYASAIRFDYYGLDEDDMEKQEDVYHNNYAVTYYYDVKDISLDDSLYICFINSLSNYKDIDGLVYKIATSYPTDVIIYNSLIAIKTNRIRTMSKN